LKIALTHAELMAKLFEFYSIIINIPLLSDLHKIHEAIMLTYATNTEVAVSLPSMKLKSRRVCLAGAKDHKEG
jgi:hypothetical protein